MSLRPASGARPRELVEAASSGNLNHVLGSFPAGSRQSVAHAARQGFLSGMNEILLLELTRRQIDGNPQIRETRFLPKLGLRAGRSQHPLADRDDQPGVLGHRNELERRDRAETRMVPAQQRLDSVAPATGQLDDRLVDDAQLLVVERVA